MKVGFTGSRTNPTDGQIDWLHQILLLSRATELHHGDCVGADKVAHGMALALGMKIVVHPPTNPKLRAGCIGDELRPEFPYLVRNKNIVDETEILVALPSGPEHVRSGTWWTIRYARGLKRPIFMMQA